MERQTDEILKKYRSRIESQLTNSVPATNSAEYTTFKEEMRPEITKYERWTLTLGNLMKINIAEKDRVRIQKELDAAHANVTASQAVTLAIFSLLSLFLLTLAISVSIFLITGSPPLLFGFLGILISFFAFYYTYTMPKRLANAWRLQASSQMVPAILYLVVYMKHTSNLERAVEFASQHLEPPLALDFKKILYDVEIGKYSTVKQSLDLYLERWRDYAPEFVESFHLIESSLYEPSETRRVQILEKSLQVILDGVYEKMLRYSRGIRSPLTNIYMLGIILPTLGLALLPLASALLQGLIKATHIFLIFNIIIPFLVFYMASEVLLRRPGGYGETSLLEKNPEYQSYISKAPWVIASVIAIPLLLIGLLPFILQIPLVQEILNFNGDATINLIGEIQLFDFKDVQGEKIGPFSPLSVIFSLFIPLGLGLFFATSYRQKTRKLILAREQTKKLEEEFTNSLFQLGNRLGDGVPAEIAFARVADSTQGQLTHDFFSIVNKNIQQSGMSVERAIFDQKQGAIIYYPSGLIATAMRILVESVKKGLQVAARSLMSISDYVKNIDKINQRLKDLLAEIVSDMRSNMVFLAPLLAGIVVGLSVMITSILTKLQNYQSDIGSLSDTSLGGLENITNLFNVAEMISPYFLQISIGVYIIEIIFILTTALVTIDAGKDPLREKHEIAQNIKRGLFLYLLTAAISTIVLTLLSSVALGRL